ncbi:MAG: hypothetical protein ACRD4X_08305 [Candidatus Acidiferrales bacterium]
MTGALLATDGHAANASLMLSGVHAAENYGAHPAAPGFGARPSPCQQSKWNRQHGDDDGRGLEAAHR